MRSLLHGSACGWPSVLCALLLCFSTAAAPAAFDPVGPPGALRCSLDELLQAIRLVETGGCEDGGRNAIGDGGRAIGPYQIHRPYWQDSRRAGRYQDCRDPEYSRRVVLAYWARWCPAALERTDAEVLARVHNGGPRGVEKASTRLFWTKVRAALETRKG